VATWQVFLDAMALCADDAVADERPAHQTNGVGKAGHTANGHAANGHA
jgi:hypothetical protein